MIHQGCVKPEDKNGGISQLEAAPTEASLRDEFFSYLSSKLQDYAVITYQILKETNLQKPS